MKNENFVVYFILDEKSEAIKIGYTGNLDSRFSGIQTGNPNPLIILHTIECRSDKQAADLEKQLHNRFDHLRLSGEWFKNDIKLLQECFKENFKFQIKQKREPLVYNTLWGEESFFDKKNHPLCFFYGNYVAQILDSYENSLRLSIPFRTMEWDTNGKMELLPYSTEINRVFISTKKHEENLKQKRFEKLKFNESLNTKANTIEQFISL
jgi:hypothetical protein